MMKSAFFYEYPGIGKVGIIEEETPSGRAISRVLFEGSSKAREDWESASEVETPLIKKAATQLREYFLGKRKVFDLPLVLHGTAFQRAVWDALLTIPAGETRCYQEVAAQVGNPKASRAVGLVNNRNPIAIIVPCHRVIGRNGKLVGYAGGLGVKEYLLKLEKQHA